MSESEAVTGLGQEAVLDEVQLSPHQETEDTEPMEDNSTIEDRTEPESSDVKSSPFRKAGLEISTATTTDEEKADERVRHTSVNSDDLLYEDSLAETKPHVPASAGDDVLLELNSEEQEQFEVIDTAGGQEQQDSMETSQSQDKEESDESNKGVESKGAASSEVDYKSGSQNYSPSSSASGGKHSKSRERDISPIVFKKKDNSHEAEKSSKPSKERSSCGPHRITEKLFSNTRYFVIKSNNFDNVDIAKTRNVWSTPPYNEKKLNKAYRDCRNVLLIFSVRESGRFQGIARLMSESRHDSHHVPWVLPPGISQSQLGGIFKLDWIHKGAVEFSVCMDLKNPWNDNKPVKISRDGQEVEPNVGEKLCRLWQNVEGDEGVLSGGRSGGSRESRHSSSSGHGSVSSSSGPFPSKGQAHMFPPAPMYFPYHQSMHQSVYPGSGDSRNPMAMSAFFSQPPSKHHLSQAEALLDSHKRRKLEHSKERSSSSRSKGHHRSSRTEGASSRSTRSPVSSSSYRTVVEKEHRTDRSSHSEKPKKSKSSKKEKEKRKDRKRSRSRSSSSSFEDDFGVKKETLLHGSYADYLKEYSSKGSAKGNVPTMADLAAAYQKALTRVASALQHQSSSSKADSKAYSKRVDEFLAKAHSKS